VFYFYNTHLSIDPTNSNYTSAQKAAMGDIHRANECKALGDHVASTTKATKCPFFIVGDFNTSFDDGEPYLTSDPARAALDKLVNYTKGDTVYDFFRDAAQIADYTRFSDHDGDIDHIFVNSRYVDVKEVHVAAEGVDGRRASDHSPLVAYCDLKANAQISDIDTDIREFEASSAEKKYTFDIAVGTGVTYDVYDGPRKIGTGSSTVIVTESGDLCALIVLTAYGTVICSVTGGGTGGIYNRGGGVMTESGNSSLLGGSNATAGASDTGSKTGFGTGGSYCLKNNIVKMSESRNLVGNIAITAGSTGMSSVTCSFTGSL
jgi:hypothetical protein